MLAQSLRVSMKDHSVRDTAEVQRRIQDKLATFRNGVRFAFAISTAVAAIVLTLTLLDPSSVTRRILLG
jgi:hypothetical protein